MIKKNQLKLPIYVKTTCRDRVCDLGWVIEFINAANKTPVAVMVTITGKFQIVGLYTLEVMIDKPATPRDREGDR